MAGIKKPSLKKSISARNPMTQVKRKYSTKKFSDPLGTANKRMYNKVYNKTTIGINDIGKSKSKGSSKSSTTYKPSNTTNKVSNCSVYEPNIDYPEYDMDVYNSVDEWLREVNRVNERLRRERELEEEQERLEEERMEQERLEEEKRIQQMLDKQNIIIALIVGVPTILFSWFVLKIFLWIFSW